MSWIDDNFDIRDEDYPSQEEENWNNGFHTDKDGKEYKLSEMTNNHLINAIKYFDRLDTSKLEKELLLRKK